MFLKRYPTFMHGVHPPEFKDETRNLPIRRFPFAPVMVILLSQHAGAPARAVVQPGQEVVRGQLIAEPNGFMSVAMHAPASGRVKRIGLAAAASGKMVPAIYLEPFPASAQEVAEGNPVDIKTATPDEIVAAIQMAGIVGLGGAAFPTHVKLRSRDDRPIDIIIINGVECEPYLTTDHRVMVEQVDDILLGIRYVQKAVNAERVIIGVEANKTDAAAGLAEAVPADLPVEIKILQVKYPQGAEKMLVKAVLDREIPSGGLPLDIGALVLNVATTAEIGRLLPHGRGIQERVITIGGPGVKKPGNYRIPIGTPLRFALEQVGLTEAANRVFLGGPMMGQTVSNLDIPITKGTSGVIVFTEVETAKSDQPVLPCIHCAYCIEACPLFLNPSHLGALARTGAYEHMAEEYHLFDCFECGACSFVCPSNIPLVHLFRTAKGIVREKQAAVATG